MMTLANAKLNQEYIIKTINTNDVELDQFLLTLGCYSGNRLR